jgi:hypothetical protein
VLQDKDALRDLVLEIELDTIQALHPLTARIGKIRHENILPTCAELYKLAEGLAIVLEQALNTCKRKAAKEIQVNDRPHPTRKEKKDLKKIRTGRHLLRQLAEDQSKTSTDTRQQMIQRLSRLLHTEKDKIQPAQPMANPGNALVTATPQQHLQQDNPGRDRSEQSNETGNETEAKTRIQEAAETIFRKCNVHKSNPDGTTTHTLENKTCEHAYITTASNELTALYKRYSNTNRMTR